MVKLQGLGWAVEKDHYITFTHVPLGGCVCDT